MDRKQSRTSFMYVGAALGSLIEELLLGDEDENVETETPTDKGTEHKSQSQSHIGEQHASGHESDGSNIDELFKLGVQLIKSIGQSTIDTTRILAGQSINRPTESPLGIEGKTGSEETTSSWNDSANS